MEHSFRAMGTEWWLRVDGGDEALLAQAEALVTSLEARLTRFRPDSALSRLNRERVVEDPVLAEVVRAAESLRERTSGAFDAAVGAAVIASGYDRSFEALRCDIASAEDIRRPRVRVRGCVVSLEGPGLLDLGGIAKGWAVDRVAGMLATAGPCLVDGGGDIAVRGRPREGEWLIGAGDGLAVGLEDGSVATSSTRRRRWRTSQGEAHHIVEPRRGRPSEGLLSAVVVAREAATADALATALVADWRSALAALPGLGAEALLEHAEGRWEMSGGMRSYLR